MDAGALDMLHDSRDHHIDAIGDAIDLDLSTLHVTVNQYRMIRRDLYRTAHVVAQLVFVIDDFHRTAAQYVGRANHDRITDIGCTDNCIIQIRDADALRARNLGLGKHFIETLTVLGPVDIIDRSPEYLDPGFLQGSREIDGRLAAKLDDDSLRFFLIDDVEYVLGRQRLEIQPVRDIKVRGDGLRVIVDDDGLNAHLFERPDRVNRAVIELDTLSDADRAGTKHNHLAGH